MNDTASIVSRVWSFCHTLRDDGVSYGDYLEQLTYLLFLKMADSNKQLNFVQHERTEAPVLKLNLKAGAQSFKQIMESINGR